MSTVLWVVDGRSWTDVHLVTLPQVYCPRFTRPPMNALQPDAMRDYNQGVEEVIPTTKQVDAT